MSRRLLLSALLILFAAPSYSGEEPAEHFRGAAEMSATPVAIDPGDPARVKIGSLTYLGGVRLRSPAPAFGGFSSMRIEGNRFTLLSDGGHLVRFDMDAGFRVRAPAFAELADGPGTGWLKGDRDSESMTADPKTGRFWVGFEQSNEIWRYDASGKAQAHLAPLPMVRWAANGGPEAMVRLANGNFIVISEVMRPIDDKTRSAREALLFRGDPTDPKTEIQRFAYRPPPGYDPTDMAELPDGRLLILHRALGLPPALFTAKLVIIGRGAVRPGAFVEGREIATFEAPLIRDNFEALAVTREGGATIVWIASDDNREWWEQSLLLKFRLD
ncbi:esterase-like activity of phytase family protein [Sphingomonas sp. LB-2]|uniref:esterase-like activity of phytase family protein n=1 Tax=Sphingomonas caeni TaxID=2984949 RepID=UPI00222F2B17|nr:esterase-like activity of phytase family protein [Sphingomonas caeni]MCW3846290.1 esterase-like activity of phytase family protein [Sphingomonas caeni]